MADEIQENADPSAFVKPAKQKLFPIVGVGSFLLHRPTNRDIIEMGKKVTVASGGMRLTDYEAQVLVNCEAVLTTIADTKPAGWNFATDDEHSDEYLEFYGRYVEWLNSFRPAQANTA